MTLTQLDSKEIDLVERTEGEGLERMWDNKCETAGLIRASRRRKAGEVCPQSVSKFMCKYQKLCGILGCRSYTDRATGGPGSRPFCGR